MIARGGEDELSHFWEGEASLSGVRKSLALGGWGACWGELVLSFCILLLIILLLLLFVFFAFCITILNL